MKKYLYTTAAALLTMGLMGCTTNNTLVYYEAPLPESVVTQMAPKPHMTKKAPATEPCTKKKELVTETIYFSNDSAAVSPMGVQKIKSFLKKQKENGNHDGYMIYVSGYANSVGNPQYNEALSKKRADAVKKALTDNGVAKWRIKDMAYGEMFPAVSTENKDWKALNRRVVIGFEPAHKK